jgi:hypothetical protein
MTCYVELLRSWLVCWLVWNSSWFRWTTGVIGAKVREFDHFSDWFCTCAIIIWIVPWHLAPRLTLSLNRLKPQDTRHLVVPLGVPKMISMPMVHSAQTVHPSSAKINTISKQTERASTWPTSPKSTIRCAENDFHAVVHSAQTCTYLAPRLTLSLNGPKQAST